MTFVDHHDGIILIGQVADFIELSNGTVHAERSIGNDDAAAQVCTFLQFFFQIGHIVVFITVTLSLAKSHPINDRRMVERIADDGILFIEQGFKNTAIGIKGSSI